MSRTRLVLALVTLALAAPVSIVAVFGSRHWMMSAEMHFGLVSAAAAIASLASLALSAAGVRARDGRSVLMGMAFSTMTALFAVHALATPGFIAGPNGVIAVAGGLSVPVGVGLLALTALPSLRRPGRVHGLIVAQVAIFFAVLLFGVVALSMPESVPAVPKARSLPALALLVFGAGCLALLITRALRTYQLTRRTADITVALGCAWLGVTLYANLVAGPMTVAYYVGHALEILAVALVTVPAALDIKRTGASRPLVGDLTATELVASEEAYLGPRVRALMIQLEQRDVSTEEHTRRVALLAALVGEELRLSADLPSPSRRRRAAARHRQARGAARILNKPGKLTDDEFAAIKRHPATAASCSRSSVGSRSPSAGWSLITTSVSTAPATRAGCTRRSSTSRPASSPSSTSTTRWSPTACTAPPGPRSAPSASCSRSTHAYDPTVVAALQRVVGGPSAFVADLSEALAPSPPTPAPRSA